MGKREKRSSSKGKGGEGRQDAGAVRTCKRVTENTSTKRRMRHCNAVWSWKAKEGGSHSV